MKRRAVAFAFALAMTLSLFGCARRDADWQFTLDARRDADDYYARSGILLAWYSYELPRLCLEGGGAEPPEALAAARDAFNAEMAFQHTLLREEYEELRDLAIDAYTALDETEREDFQPLGNRIEVTDIYQTARLVSVRAEGWADRGGARATAFTRAWSFDLERGEFITWMDLAKQPETLRAAMAGEIRAQVAQRDTEWFEDALETAERLEGCAVYLGEDGMTVIFDAQRLAPRAAGAPAFEIPYDALRRYLSAYGKQVIKKAD